MSVLIILNYFRWADTKESWCFTVNDLKLEEEIPCGYL